MKVCLVNARCVPNGDNCPQKETSPKGITLITLVITVIIIIIIASVSIQVGTDVIQNSNATKLNTELKIIHAKVNEITEEKSQEELNNLGTELSGISSSLQAKIQVAMQGASTDGFRYFNKSDLEAIGITNINRQVIINFSTREVVDINGVKKNGEYVYRVEGWQNIVYQNRNTEAPEFSLTKKVYGLTANVKVTNIEYKGNVGKGQVSYCLFNNETEGNWKTVSAEEFTVEQSGIYKVKLTDSAGNSTDKTIEIVLANKPKLDLGMTPVIYDSTLGKWKKVEENSGDWYDYASDKKQWANVMLQDGLVVNADGTIDNDKMGSMFVWIPRYMYQIPAANYHTSTAGEIQIKFLKGTTNIATDGTNVAIANASGGDNWNVHPAFCDGTKNNYANGEWDKDITGIWVAKFEASSSNNTAQYGGGNTTELDVKILPNVPSWRYIIISNMFEVCNNMSSKDIYGFSSYADTHLIKNSEWGAIVYISYSKYGKNGQVWNNPYRDSTTSTILTGKVATTAGANAGNTTDCDSYNEGNGPQGSTSGNIYGIYDMAGGSWELTASYINNKNVQSNSNITKLREADLKYKDQYKISTEDQGKLNYEANKEKYGDVVYEISKQGTGASSWGNDYSSFPSSSFLVFQRGGDYSYGSTAGICALGNHNGTYSANTSFRPVCIVE